MRLKPILRIFAILLTAGILSHAQDKPSADSQIQFNEPPETPIGKSLRQAKERHFEAQEKVNGAYRKDLAAALATATDIEIYLLASLVEHLEDPGISWWFGLPEDQFPIIPYGASCKILQRKKLTEAEAKRFMPAFQPMLAAQDAPSGTLCHYPVHGIRIRDGGNIVFQTSLCYECGNFYIAHPVSDMSDAGWTGISGTELEKVMRELMPIPPKGNEGKKPEELEKK